MSDYIISAIDDYILRYSKLRKVYICVAHVPATPMYVCMYACMYACVYACMYACVYKYLLVSVHGYYKFHTEIVQPLSETITHNFLQNISLWFLGIVGILCMFSCS